MKNGLYKCPRHIFPIEKIGQFLNIYTDFTTLHPQKTTTSGLSSGFSSGCFLKYVHQRQAKSGTSQKCYFSASRVCLPVMSVILSATVWPAWKGANELDHGEITLTEIAWQLISLLFPCSLVWTRPTHRRILAATGKFWQTPICFFYVCVSSGVPLGLLT